jgi:hypothetical protein
VKLWAWIRNQRSAIGAIAGVRSARASGHTHDSMIQIVECRCPDGHLITALPVPAQSEEQHPGYTRCAVERDLLAAYPILRGLRNLVFRQCQTFRIPFCSLCHAPELTWLYELNPKRYADTVSAQEAIDRELGRAAEKPAMTTEH